MRKVEIETLWSLLWNGSPWTGKKPHDPKKFPRWSVKAEILKFHNKPRKKHATKLTYKVTRPNDCTHDSLLFKNLLSMLLEAIEFNQFF